MLSFLSDPDPDRFRPFFMTGPRQILLLYSFTIMSPGPMLPLAVTVKEAMVPP